MSKPEYEHTFLKELTDTAKRPIVYQVGISAGAWLAGVFQYFILHNEPAAEIYIALSLLTPLCSREGREIIQSCTTPEIRVDAGNQITGS